MNQTSNKYELKGLGLAAYIAIGVGAIIACGIYNGNRIEKGKQAKLEQIAMQKNEAAVKEINQFVDGLNRTLPDKNDYQIKDVNCIIKSSKNYGE